MFLAVFVATARDARRFVVGLVTAAVAWFIVVYPNFSALPLPTVVANAYQGVLPTYPYPFQFPSNRSEVVKDVKLLDPIALDPGGVARAAVRGPRLLGVGLADRHRRAGGRRRRRGGRRG